MPVPKREWSEAVSSRVNQERKIRMEAEDILQSQRELHGRIARAVDNLKKLG